MATVAVTDTIPKTVDDNYHNIFTEGTPTTATP